LTIGKSALGRVHVSGLSLVPNPPIRISAFTAYHKPNGNTNGWTLDINNVEKMEGGGYSHSIVAGGLCVMS
jgi:hypothetical protein